MKRIVDRLRDYDGCHDGDIDDAADMLDLLLNQMQIASCKMDSQHHWRFRGGWPMNHAIGPSAEDAIRAVMAEVKRAKNEGQQSVEGKK